MTQEEVELRARLVVDALKQGCWATATNDRFVSGKPDMRIAHRDLFQLDIELKIIDPAASTLERGATVATGITKLQAIELRNMNAAGVMAVGMVLLKPLNEFIFCNFEKVNLMQAIKFGSITYRRLPKKEPCIAFADMMLMARQYLRSIT